MYPRTIRVTVRMILQGFIQRTHLPNNLRRLCIVDGSKILLHRCVIVTFLVEVVPILSVDYVLLCDVYASFLGKINGQKIKVSLVEDVKLLLQ